MEVFVADPGTPGPWPAVVLYPDSDGLSEPIREIAARVAAQGYLCVVPDLYYRLGKIVVAPGSKAPAAVAIRRAAVASLRNWSAMSDTRALLDFLSRDARPGPKGVVGRGIGGRLAVLAAGQFAQELRAAAALFAPGLVTEAPDSPHLVLHKTRGALYCGFAAQDPLTPAATIEEFRGLVHERCSAESQVELHPGTRAEAAELCWQKTLATLARQLR